MSTVLGTYDFGTVARYNLFKQEKDNRVNRKLDIEYRNDDHSAFRRMVFSHEIHQGLRYDQWVNKGLDQEHFSVSLVCLSVPTTLNSQLNLYVQVAHIQANQELHHSFYSIELLLPPMRQTETVLITVAHNFLRNNWQAFIEGDQAHKPVTTKHNSQTFACQARDQYLRGLSI